MDRQPIARPRAFFILSTNRIAGNDDFDTRVRRDRSNRFIKGPVVWRGRGRGIDENNAEKEWKRPPAKSPLTLTNFL